MTFRSFVKSNGYNEVIYREKRKREQEKERQRETERDRQRKRARKTERGGGKKTNTPI